MQRGTNCRYRIFGECIASVRLQSTRCLADALRSAAAQRFGQRNVLWNLKSTTLLEIPSCTVRFSSCNRSAPPVVFRSWCAQLKNWSNTKSFTERNVARQTPLHNLPTMRGAMLNCRIVKVLTLLMVIIPTPARSHANFCPTTGRYKTHARATLCDGHVCMILTPNGEMKIFADGVQVFHFLDGRWRLTDAQHKYDLGKRPSPTQNWQNVCLLRP